LQHTVAVGDNIRSVRVAPRNPVPLKRLEPVVENLGIRAKGVWRVRALDGVLMQKSHRRLDQLHIAREKKRKANWSRFTKLNP
jgi:hypothetical protein